MLALALASALVWGVLLFARGGFWTCRDHDRAWSGTLTEGQAWPSVTVIVPARDEAECIGRSIGALLDQDYPGRFRVVLVDDDSCDGTGAIAEALAEARHVPERLTVLRNRQLPAGWTGKLFAMATGLAAVEAADDAPDFVLFCDADIALAPDTLRMLAAKAVHERRVLVSLMARLSVATPAEKALVPAFIYFFAKLYPFAWVSNPKSPVAAAAGGCMLVDWLALKRAGGLERIRTAIIDDCALGRLMKGQGSVALALTDRALSLRVYSGIGPIRRMVVRSAYAELKHSPLRLVLAMLGLGLTYMVPPALAVLADGLAGWIGLGVTLAMMASFVPILRFYRLSPVLALTLPLIAIAYAAFTVESAIRHWRGRGGEWKGRYQDVARGGHSS
ncbi:MAG: glycosyl transferase family 2 [Methylobacterium sp.]|nr:MAG: glycosyl transferase family 2 [Methylobacterium sp.]